MEISFIDDKCYITSIHEESNRYQILTIPEYMAKNKVIQKKNDIRMNNSTSEISGAKQTTADKMQNVLECFAAILDFVFEDENGKLNIVFDQ